MRAQELPDARHAKMTMLRAGWIERRDLPEVAYRITETGLAELRMQRQV